MLQTVSGLVATAIEQRIFPGAVVLVAINGVVELHEAYGTTMYAAPDTRRVTPDTIYDVASLTKVFTATAALQLVDAGLIDLYAPVATYLPEMRAADVRVIHLLTHSSGLDLRLSVLRERERAELLATIFATVPVHAPGTVVAYTNVNALLLGEIVARVCAEPFDQALRRLVLAPLGLRDTQFTPPPTLRARIAPTEVDLAWRGGLVHGSVHDESTHALGGVAGHAGLFSTATELWMFCQAWLDAVSDHKAARQLLTPATARRATTNQTPDMPWACGLGWMMDRANFMGGAPLGSFGHTGFTGPAIVVVPKRRTIVVVLSNRVYPQRQPPPYRHHAVTAAIVDLALS